MISAENVSYQAVADDLSALRNKNPLIHCLTNEVVQEITANVLLAAGASPAMVVGDGEVSQFASISSAISINVGTPYADRIKVMKLAAQTAQQHKIPWVLDPVAAGVMPWRDSLIFELLSMSPTAVRGNASEIKFLAGKGQGGKGVDSLDSSESAIEAAIEVAKKFHCLVTVTGKVDYVTDGQRLIAIPGGSALITKVVGTGCSLSALLAAFIAVSKDALQACASCCTYVSLASDSAARLCSGPGSFHVSYLDSLYKITPQDFL